jgi:hypothetical protein
MRYLLAGTGQCDITPAPGTPQGGWGAQTHERGIGADTPLYARALIVSDSDTSVAIVDIDACGFYDVAWIRRTIDGIAELTQIPREHIRFSYTHTHSGPNSYRLAVISEGLDLIHAYLSDLPGRIAGAVWQARQNLKPVRCAAARGTCDINVNRRTQSPEGRVVVGRNPQGLVDRTVQIVRFDTLDENPVATLVHYACHPTIMAWQCQHFTPDYPGIVKQTVEQELGGLCLFLQGAAGNIGPKYGFTGDLQVYRRLGKILGLEAAKVAANIETVPRRPRFVGVQTSGAPIALYEDEPVHAEPQPLRVVYQTMRVPLKKFQPLDQLEAELVERVRELNRLRCEGVHEKEIQMASALASQAEDRVEDARLYHEQTHLEWPLQGMRIGNVALLAMPGEPFIELNQRILRDSPFEHTLFSGYSNGPFGYLPHREAFSEGGFEVETSPFSPDAADVVVKESLQVLHELAAT